MAPNAIRFVLKRGAYDAPGEKVTAGVPEILPQLPPDRAAQSARLGALAGRIGKSADGARYSQSLLAILFRLWNREDRRRFRFAREFPVHPELLDWLAVEFMESGWDVKAMQKLIVMSAAYRQSSVVTPALLEKDPDNRLLARGPRLRLGPEAIRDQALAVSGLLVGKAGRAFREALSAGGPVAGTCRRQGLCAVEKGEDLYRRSLYTYWKRTVAAAFHDEFRFAESRTMRGFREPNQLSPPGARSDERRHVPGSFAKAGRAHDERRRRIAGGAARLWIFTRARPSHHRARSR